MSDAKRKPTAKNAQNIQAEHHDPTFFAMIPKMAIMDLDPYELALYCNYKQTVGENGGARITKTNATVAAETKMSVNRMKASRAALERKHYIYVKDNPDADGNINQPPTVIVRDIWSINHQIYSTPLTSLYEEGYQTVLPPLSPNDTPLPSGDTPLSRGDTKEEPYKKNQIKDSAPQNGAVPAAEKRHTARLANPWYDAVFSVWGYTASMNGEMAKMLQGHAARKGFKEYNLEPGLTPQNICDWAQWYRNTELGGKADMNMLEERIKVQSSLTRWRSGLAHTPSALDGLKLITATAAEVYGE